MGGVCGGGWLAIYFVLSYFGTMGMLWYGEDEDWSGRILSSFTMLPGVVFDPDHNPKMIIFRWLDNFCGYLLIAAFASFKFSCSICANEEYRQFGQNQVIDRVFIIGCICWIIDVVLFIMLRCMKVFVDGT